MSIHRKWLKHNPVEFTARKQEAVPDYLTRQDKNPLFSTYTGKQLQKHNVIAATLILGRKTDVENTLLKRKFKKKDVLETFYVDILLRHLLDVFPRHFWARLQIVAVKLSRRHLLYVLPRQDNLKIIGRYLKDVLCPLGNMSSSSEAMFSEEFLNYIWFLIFPSHQIYLMM